MALSDSMFMFEMLVEELDSYITCKEFKIAAQFADVFCLNLKDPNHVDPFIALDIKKKIKVRKASVSSQSQKPTTGGKGSGQSVVFVCRVHKLITNMKNHPIELTLYDKDDPDHKVGSTHVPWSPIYIDYLYSLLIKSDSSPAYVSNRYNVYDESISKRIVTLRLSSKLIILKNKIMTYRSLSESQTNLKNIRLKPNFSSRLKERRIIAKEQVDIIKTNNNGKKGKTKPLDKQKSKDVVKEPSTIKEKCKSNSPVNKEKIKVNLDKEVFGDQHSLKTSRLSLLSFIKSDTNLDKNKQIDTIEVIKTNSCTSVNQKNINILNYIFGNCTRPPREQVLCVSYFTVENDFNDSSSKESSKQGNIRNEDSETSESKDLIYKFAVCDDICPAGPECSTHIMDAIEVREDDTDRIQVVKCDRKKQRELPPPADERILVDLKNLKADCCNVNKIVKEEVVGGMTAKMKLSKDDCFCSCECTFGFIKHTSYCGVCGGYETIGEDLPKKQLTAPFPCPIFHKADKTIKPSTPSEKSRNKCDEILQKPKKGSRSPSGKTPPSAKSVPGTNESEKDPKKKSKKEQAPEDRFKFNYGYTAPHIGHSQCGMPCTGTLGAVPKNMGWLWTADNIPGLRFRPNWQPGAVHKNVLRLLKMAKNPGIILSKKKKKDAGKKKRPLKRPLLTVAKKDGEYTVTMETMKIYPKQRTLNQQPYEDKPLVTYTIGRTEEENRERKKKKEREQRRLERDQRAFIQSAFHDMCKEICLKTYQQALGILPDAETPDCPCYPIDPGPEHVNLEHSCSCSEDLNLSNGSETDSDEWIVEFTPPNATFDPTYKSKKVLKADNTTQYTYLDFRVKLLDRAGNQVPRFFKGPDGKTQCSDLGGFWSRDHKWLEINIDGYIAPDEKWAPMAFIGPNGEHVECDNGKFQLADLSWLVVGVDGYVDETGKWKYYAKRKDASLAKKRAAMAKMKKDADNKKGIETPYKPSEVTWSCFGDAEPTDLSKLGILGHGTDKKLLLKILREKLSRGEDITIPEPSTVPRIAHKKGKKNSPALIKAYDSYSYFLDRQRCRHPIPSDKGIVAVDGHGNKTYFRLKDHKSLTPRQRITKLTKQGISVSSFHVPCFSSFINSEMMKQQLYEKLMNRNKGDKNVCDFNVKKNTVTKATEAVYKNVIV